MNFRHASEYLLKVLGWLSHFIWWLVAALPLPFLKSLKERQKYVKDHPLAKLPGKKPVALYFCSSAGEFEQVLPVIERLDEMEAIVCFFSMSGISYAAKRAEVPYFLFPGDRKCDVLNMFQVFSPKLVVVNRWEFWPNFLMEARKRSHLSLINFAVTNPKLEESWIKRACKRALLSSFHNIYCVGADNAAYAECLLGTSVVKSTDTKFDRVLDRSQPLWEEQSESGETRIARTLKGHLKNEKVLVMGSSWKEDHALILPVLAKKSDWSAIVCPHDISEENIALCCEQLEKAGLTYCLYSDLPLNPKKIFHAIVINNIGMLAEVYSAGDVAWVGGGCHYRIHNTLEPASYDLPLAFGPMHETSIEAISMVQTGMALSTRNAADIERWLDSPGPSTRGFVEKRAGGAQTLASLLRKEIDTCKL